MTSGYSNFCDDFLLFAADLQTGSQRTAADLHWFMQHKRPDAPPTWAETIVPDLVRQGYGKDWGNLKQRAFMIDGPGLARAEALREQRRPKSVLERLGKVPRSDWIALGAFIVSLVALFK